MNAENEVLACLASESEIPKNEVLEWMQNGDLPTHAAVYCLTGRAWYRIQPELSQDEQCGFMKRYLLECLETDPDDESDPNELLHNGFQAAGELARWIKHLARMPEAQDVVNDLTAMYLRADAVTRNRIETGALEHILEYAPLVPLFAFWRDNPVLKNGFEACLAWGEAHPET